MHRYTSGAAGLDADANEERHTHRLTSRSRSRDVGRRRHTRQARQRGGLHCDPVMQVARVAERFLQPGTVVFARIPFEDDPETGKWRPSVVVSKAGRAVRVMPVTSSLRAKGGTHVADLDVAGLTKASTVRTAHATVVERYDVARVLGHLSAVDFARVFGREVA